MMKTKDVLIGRVYAVKIGRNLCGVRIMKTNPKGGWDGVTLDTDKPIHIKSTQRLKGVWNPKSKTKIYSPDKILSGLNAAAKVLAEAKEPLSVKAITQAMIEQGLWASEGKTPSATIYSAMIREIAAKGDKSRFRKVERGRFELVT